MGRKELARKTFIQGGVSLPTAEKLSGIVETTASRRGRIEPDIIAAVCDPGYFLDQGTCKKTVQVSQPPPNIFAPPAPKPSCRPDEMYDEGSNSCIPRTVPGLACFQFAPKQSIARGVSYSGCPGRPGYVYASDLNDQANLTTERYFGEAISSNQRALKAAGYKSRPSNSELSRLAFDIGKASQVMIKQCKKSFSTSPGCRSASATVQSLQKRQKDAQTGNYGWF